MTKDNDEDNGLAAAIFRGKTADGKRIGDDPDFINFLRDLAQEDVDAQMLDDDTIIELAIDAGLPSGWYGGPWFDDDGNLRTGLSPHMKRFVNLILLHGPKGN